MLSKLVRMATCFPSAGIRMHVQQELEKEQQNGSTTISPSDQSKYCTQKTLEAKNNNKKDHKKHLFSPQRLQCKNTVGRMTVT